MRLPQERFWRRAAFALVLVGFGGFRWWFHLWAQYWDRLPRAPDKVAGRIFADNFHGVIVYESRDERFRLYATEYSGEATAALGFLIWGLREWKWPRKNKFSIYSGVQDSHKR